VENDKKRIYDDDFIELVNLFACPLILFANFAQLTKNNKNILNTLFLGRSHSVASRLEEVLDFYNANNNEKWKPFREIIAAIKLFTNVAYITLHLKSVSPKYKLLSGIDVFLEDTEAIIETFSEAIQWCFSELIKLSKKNHLEVCSEIDKSLQFFVDFPEGQLESDLDKRKIENPETMIVNLATSYLNLASESELLEKIKTTNSKNYEELIPEVVSENKLRILENKFHNLQSLYDTHISNTDIEVIDYDLRLIRGHASIIYHLLEAATSLIHYYERHMMNLVGTHEKFIKSPLSVRKILGILIDYYMNYATQFLSTGRDLSMKVIRKYAEEGLVEVNVPGYRGFHVRPSTLVSKIIQHYGSVVYLIMGDQKYDASSPMNLFRVNEKINAEKRRNLAQKICSLDSINNPECNKNFDKGLKEIFHELLEQNKIINYTTEFFLPDFKSLEEETLAEFANRAIAFLLAQGKIDIRTDLTVFFQGDKRVLSDLQILANCGYGEDNYGNNIVLPEELSYLKR
jgi:hypothetical protein